MCALFSSIENVPTKLNVQKHINEAEKCAAQRKLCRPFVVCHECEYFAHKVQIKAFVCTAPVWLFSHSRKLRWWISLQWRTFNLNVRSFGMPKPFTRPHAASHAFKLIYLFEEWMFCFEASCEIHHTTISSWILFHYYVKLRKWWQKWIYIDLSGA